MLHLVVARDKTADQTSPRSRREVKRSSMSPRWLCSLPLQPRPRPRPIVASPSPAAKPSRPYLLDPAAPVAPALLASRTHLRRARRRRWSLPQLCAAGRWWIYSHRIHRRSRARDSTIPFASLDEYSRRLDGGPHGITTDLQFFSLLIASSVADLVSALMTAEDCVKSRSARRQEESEGAQNNRHPLWYILPSLCFHSLLSTTFVLFCLWIR